MGALLVRLVVVGMTSVHRAGRPPNTQTAEFGVVANQAARPAAGAEA